MAGVTAWSPGCQQEILAGRDAGDVDEFPGVPDTQGEVFTRNRPVPTLAPITFEHEGLRAWSSTN